MSFDTDRTRLLANAFIMTVFVLHGCTAMNETKYYVINYLKLNKKLMLTLSKSDIAVLLSNYPFSLDVIITQGDDYGSTSSISSTSEVQSGGNTPGVVDDDENPLVNVIPATPEGPLTPTNASQSGDSESTLGKICTEH